jgi:hypothetical protein
MDFLQTACLRGGLNTGKKCGSPTAVQPRSHHTNDIPTGKKLWGAHRSPAAHWPAGHDDSSMLLGGAVPRILAL